MCEIKTPATKIRAYFGWDRAQPSWNFRRSQLFFFTTPVKAARWPSCVSCPRAFSTSRDHVHTTDRTHVAADARCVARTQRRICGSRSQSLVNPEDLYIQPPRRTHGIAQSCRGTQKENRRETVEGLQSTSSAQREICDPDGYRTRARRCAALPLLRRRRENQRGPRPKQRELYKRKLSSLLRPL